ncbi:MAG TPA: WYL domain-containing protein [Acidimicrobiia bacterium]
MSPALAASRLRRMLALVPWILAHPGTTISDLAQRFEVPESELESDLELLPLCGLPPYSADRLIDVIVGDDGAVDIRLAEYFERPLRLTPSEAVALVAAGRALLAVPGSDDAGPLATALDKVEQALGARGVLTVDVGSTDQLERLTAAAHDGEQLELDYYSAARDELTTRVVDPVRVFHAVGAWYLAAYCHRAGADRLFRVDRIRAVRPTGERVPTRPVADDDLADLVYRPAPTDPRVRLRLAPDAAWVAETVPTEEVTPRRGGGFDVVLAVSGPAFLERLLLQLGPSARVLDPPEAAAARADAAGRVLARYGTAPV